VNHDVIPALRSLQDAVVTGHTGTNVNDSNWDYATISVETSRALIESRQMALDKRRGRIQTVLGSSADRLGITLPHDTS
jgi:hypothetical protein